MVNPEEKSLKPSRRTVFGIAAGVVIVVAMIVIAVMTAPSASVAIEEDDRVKIQYTVWVGSSENSPKMNKTLWVEVDERDNRSGEVKGLILGLFEELLGKAEGYYSDEVYLEPCEDKDFDGQDDNTGDEALSYGLPSDELFGESIYFRVIVLEIELEDE